MPAALLAVVVAGVGVLFVLPVGWVNFDGAGYLSLAANLSDGNGYVAPDGTAMTIRGPGYPALLGAAWILFESSMTAALAMSRSALLVGGCQFGHVRRDG